MYKIIIAVMLSLLPTLDAECAALDADAQHIDYRLGAGDVIGITVDSIPELSLKYTVSETGDIVFPTLLTPLMARGLTSGQLQALLVETLTEYMYEPKVSVSILEHHSHKVLVLGPFQSPGKYELKREKVPLLDIVTESGGLREIEENDELIILRNPSTSDLLANGDVNIKKLSELMRPIRIDLQRLLRDGDLTQNVMVQAGDVIYLNSFFAAEKYVYVTGGGRRGAGAVPYEKGLTAFKALLRAGVVPDDPQALELIIVRGQTGGERFISTQLNFDSAHLGEGDLTLLPEDIVILPENSQVVYVAGKVNRPGALSFQEGLTVLQAVLDAGGMSIEAVGAKAKILREGENGRVQIPVDMDAILEKGDKAQNVALISGDIIVVPGMSLQADVMVTGKVNSPGMVPYEDGITAMKAIFLAGGLSDNALKSQIRVMKRGGGIHPPFLLDISKTQLEEVGGSNPILEAGDLMVILGEAPGHIISVLGKVRRPGIIQYEGGLTALQAILRAGGFDQGAARSKVKVVRGDGEQQQKFRADLEELMDKGDRSGDVSLLPGDIIIVPETFF